ncbi:MAG: DUF4214 domain-containing protein [Reyranellaceae bacterium]
MTTMNFTLSTALQQQLLNNHSYVWALEYANGTYLSGASTPLVSNGAVQSGNLSVTLPTPFSSGQVFLVVSNNASVAQTLSTSQSGADGAINSSSAQSLGYQYQLVEATLTPSPNDLGDISSVNAFAFPVQFADANGTRGFSSATTGSQLLTKLQAIAPGSVLAGMAFGPAQGPNMASNPWPSSDWTTYVNSLTNGSTNAIATLSAMNIVTYYGPTNTISQYGVTYDTTSQYFYLKPNLTNGATNTDWIRISTSNLLNSIYAQTGSIEISTNQGQSWTTSTTFTPNTADGTVTKYFVAGFDAGYWGGSATSPNPADPSKINLNTTANWNYNYAYDATFNGAGSAITYTNLLGSGPGTAGGGNRFYDPWAQLIQSNSNSYGWSYGDLISQGGTNPQISLWSANAQVPSIGISLYANSDAPAGYVPIPLAYVAPPAGGPTWPNSLPAYYAVNTPAASFNQNVLNFSFSLGNPAYAPNAQTPLAFRFFAPSDSSAGTDGFVTLSVTGSAAMTDWQALIVKGGPGSWTLQANGGAPPNGQLSIYNVPVTANGSTGWYQLVFGDSAHQTTYNIYASSSNGLFLDNSQTASNFVVDHGLGYGSGEGVSFNTGVNGYTLSFAPSGVITYDIATFSAPGTLFGTNTTDMLSGTNGADIINGAPGNDLISGGPGDDTAVSWLPSKNFTLASYAGSPFLVSQDRVGTDGTDTLDGIEKLQFGDRTIDATTILKTAASSADQVLKIIDLYSQLGRAPDALGLDYWTSQLHDGRPIQDIAKSFFKQPEPAALYPAALSDQDFVTAFYGNVFGRAPDASGLAYWTSQLQHGQARDSFVLAFISGARGGDLQTLTNKEMVSARFALTQGLTDSTWAKTVMAHVDSTAASVTAANAQTDGFAAIAANPATTELIVQIVGIAIDQAIASH